MDHSAGHQICFNSPEFIPFMMTEYAHPLKDISISGPFFWTWTYLNKVDPIQEGYIPGTINPRRLYANQKRPKCPLKSGISNF
jgi:hypothetical protein